MGIVALVAVYTQMGAQLVISGLANNMPCFTAASSNLVGAFLQADNVSVALLQAVIQLCAFHLGAAVFVVGNEGIVALAFLPPLVVLADDAAGVVYIGNTQLNAGGS